MALSLVYIPGSPYARKIRVVLAELGVSCEEHLLETYPPTARELGSANPTLRVPVLRDGPLELYESDMISDYLFRTYPNGPTSVASDVQNDAPPLERMNYRPDAEWEDRKLLAAIASATDTMVLLAYHAWCGLGETRENVMGFGLKERWETRVHTTLDWLDGVATPEGFTPGRFTLADIAMICALDWTDARLKFPWGAEGRPRENLQALVARFIDRASFRETAYSPMPDHLAKALDRA